LAKEYGLKLKLKSNFHKYYEDNIEKHKELFKMIVKQNSLEEAIDKNNIDD